MKYEVGDRVRIKSLDWYNENKDNYDCVYAGNGFGFWKNMSRHCGEIMKITIVKVDPKDSNKGYYFMENCEERWTDEMIEGLVEEEKSLCEGCCSLELKFNKLTIADNICTDKVEVILQDYELKKEGDKWFAVKKKKEYPKTYEECCVDLGLKVCPKVKVSIGDTPTYREHIVETFIELLACRDAYLKRYEIEMKLNSRWTPDYEDLNTTKFCITTSRDKVIKVESSVQNYVLAFPTEEMRDAFYKNFKSEIERCKELL